VMATVGAIASVLTRVDGGSPLSVAALELSRAGVPVFPCIPGGKRPLTEHGFHDATTDPGQVEAWWRQHPDANIGVPTGPASGVVVVDVDVHGSIDGYRTFEHAHRAGLVSGWQFRVTTPSGGMHAYYPATPGKAQRSWQAPSAAIDFRGDGGYILVPPSAVSTGGTAADYQVRRINVSSVAPLDSDQLRDFLDPRPAPRRPTRQGGAREADVSRLASWVAARGEGERNRGLFWAACRLAENGLPASDALDVLSAAASNTGLGEREITATVRSAYRTAHPGTRDSSSPARGSSPLAPDGWFARDASRQSRSRVREL